MAERDQQPYSQSLFADTEFSFNLDPLGSAETYLDREGPWDVRPYEIAKQAVSGYLSGFLTLPIGEVSTNRIEQMARQAGHLAGFIGLFMPKKMIRSAGRQALSRNGMSSAAAGFAEFRSVPFLAADVAMRKLNKAGPMKAAMSYLDATNRLGTRQFIQEGLHLGIASAASAWSEGVRGMAMAGLQGGLLGGGSALLSNLPLLKARDTTSNVLRAMSGAVIDAAPTYFQGGDAVDIAYSALLGSYFGYRQPNAEMARAQEFYYRDHSPEQRGNKGFFFGKESGYRDLPKAVQEEVQKLSDLDRNQEVGTAFGQIARALLGESVPMETPEAKKARTMREELNSWLDMRMKYNTGLAPQRALVRFSEGLIKEGTNPRLKSWHADEVATLIETVGQQAREEGMTWDAFKQESTTLLKNATGEDVTPEQIDQLREYHLNRTQTRDIPTMGFDETYGLVQFNQGRRDFAGNLIDTDETINQVNLIQRENGMLGDMPDTAGHFVISGYQYFTQKSGVRVGDTQDIPTDLLLHLDGVAANMKEKYFSVLDDDGTERRVPLYDENGEARFYFAHGENDKSKVHALLYNTGDDLIAERERIFRAMASRGAKDRKPKEQKAYVERLRADYDQLRTEFARDLVGIGSQRFRSPEDGLLEYDRQFVSNVRYWEQMNKGVKLEDLLGGGDFLNDVSKFNKRLQPLFNNFYRVGEEIIDRPTKYLLVDDLASYATVDGKRLGAEVTDGSVLVSDDVFDRLIKFSNLKDKDGSSLKPFILSNDQKNGLLIGKMAFHRADQETGAAMAKAGVDFLIHKSAAKQIGLRKTHRYRLSGEDLTITGDDGAFRSVMPEDLHDLPISDIMMGLDKGDNIKNGARIAKQMATMLAHEQLQYHAENGRLLDKYGDRAAADSRERKLYDEVIQKGLLGDGKTLDLDNYMANPSAETLDKLFEGGSNAPVERVNKINLFNQAFKKGNEELRDRLTKHLFDKESRGELEDDDEVMPWASDGNDRADALEKQFDDAKGPADIIFRQMIESGQSTHAVGISSHVKRKTASLFANWIVKSMTKPIHESGFKAIMKPVTPGIARNIAYDGKRIQFGDDDLAPGEAKARPNLTPNTFLLEDGLKTQKIDSSVRVTDKEGVVRYEAKKRTIEEVYNDFQATPDADYRDRLRKDLTAIVARVPLGDISGSQDLVLAGFTGTRGKGVVLHETTMKRLGGADLDIDDAFMYFNMPEFMREVVHVNRENQERYAEIEKDRVGIYLRRPENLMGFRDGATADQKMLTMFDPMHRLAIGQAVSAGRSSLTGIAVNNRLILSTMYSHAMASGGYFDDALPGGYRLRYTARKDNGELLRARSDGAVSAAVDVANYGAVARPHEMLAIQLHGAFERIDIIDPKGNAVRTVLDDGALVKNHFGELHFAEGKTGGLLEMFTMGNNTIRAGFGDAKIEFKLSDTMLESLRNVNRVMFGRDKRTQRPYDIREKVEASRAYPTDADGNVPRGYLYELSRKMGTLEPDNMDIVDYVFAPESRFESNYNRIASYINQNGGEQARADVPFFFADGHRITLPTKSFLSLVRVARDYYGPKDEGGRTNPFDLRTSQGRAALAANTEAYEKLVAKIEQVDAIARGKGVAQYVTGAKTFEERVMGIDKLHAEITRFVDHGIDEIAAIPVVRNMYVASGLTPDEGHQLLKLATYIKGAFAKSHMDSLNRIKTGKTEQGVNRYSKSAERYATDIFQGMYRDFFSGRGIGEYASDAPDVGRMGIDAWVAKLNESPARRSSQEAQVSVEGVRDFFDSLLISSHGSSSVYDHLKQQAEKRGEEFKPALTNRSLNVLRTASKSIGFEVASPTVVKEWVEQYDNMFGNVVTGRRQDPVRPLMQGSVGRNEAERAYSAYETIRHVVYPDDAPVSDEVAKVRDSIIKLASTYPAFRDDPNNVLYVMRSMYGKAMPTDFSIDDLRGFESLLKKWKTGGTFVSWFTREGGVKILGRARELAAKDGREFSFWHTLQFARTVSDYTKIDDIRLIDKEKHSGGKLLRTNRQLEDGTWESTYVAATTKEPESWFDRLIDINGQSRDTLTNSAYNKISDEINASIAPFMKAGFRARGSNADHRDDLYRIAIHERELAGALRAMERAKARNEPTENHGAFVDQFKARKDRAMRELAEKHGIETKGMDRNEVEKTLSDMEYTVQVEGVQRTMTVREITDEIGRRHDVLDKIFDEHIRGEAWVKKYLLPHVGADGEINIGQWSRSLETMFQRGLPDSPDQHIPHDVSQLFAMENEIRIEAARLLQTGGVRIPTSTTDVRNMRGVADQDVLSVARELLERPLVAQDAEEAHKLAEDLRRRVKETKSLDEDVVRGLNRFADYLSYDLPDRDMRRLWTKDERYSQFAEDLKVAADPQRRLSYVRKRLRQRVRQETTERIDGAFPHLSHDRKMLEADALERVRQANDPEVAEAIRAELNDVLQRSVEPDQVSDAYADLILENDTEKFFANFRTETFASAMDRKRNWDGYVVDPSILNEYSRRLASASYNNIAHTISRNAIRAFETSGAMGEHNATWANWMRLYVRDTMSKPSTFTPGLLDDPGLNLKRTPYYWLSDHAVATKGTGVNKMLMRINGMHKVTEVDRELFRMENGRDRTAAEEKQFEQDMLTKITKVSADGTLRQDQIRLLGRAYKGASDLEAKYEMMALLFHAKAYVANKVGGISNMVAHSGWAPFRQSGKIEYWQGLNPEFKSMADVNQWVAKMGVIEDYIVHEAGITGRFREGKWSQFVDEVTSEVRKNPTMTDDSLYEIAKRNGITEKSVDIGAWFMRKSERDLRTRSFLAGYIAARDSMAPMDGLPFDHPHLIDRARKAVATSQFLYGASERPAFARTSFGKVYSRFKLWGWSSPKMRRTIYQEARERGFAIGSPEFDRLRRIVFADLMAASLSAMFPFSLFEYTLPPPLSWFADLADYFFGEGYEKDSAFFGSPLGPINELMPVIGSKFVNIGDTTFRALVSGEVDTMATYQLATLFPFGRMGYDVARTLQNPANAPRYMAGIPLREFAGLRDKVVRGRSIATTAPVLQQSFEAYGDGATEKEVIAFFEEQGYEATEARLALKDALSKGVVSRSLERTNTGRAYLYKMDGGNAEDLVQLNSFGATSMSRGY